MLLVQKRAPLTPLAAPPRRVPYSLQARLIFGGALGVFAWIWFGFGSSIATVFLRNSDFSSWIHFRRDTARAPGVVARCEDTNAAEGGSKTRRGTPIYANHYRFVAAGRMHEGVAYAPGVCLEAGQAVLVEHVAADPAISRLPDMRRAPFGPGTLFVSIFPIVGVLLVGFNTRAGLRQLRLLSRGKLALGKLLDQQSTNTSINNRRVMKLRFEFETDSGARRQACVRTHLPEHLEDELEERLLYDPAHPDQVVAWDLLPRSLRVDALGTLQPAGAVGTFLVLIPPALAVLGHLLALS